MKLSSSVVIALISLAMGVTAEGSEGPNIVAMAQEDTDAAALTGSTNGLNRISHLFSKKSKHDCGKKSPEPCYPPPPPPPPMWVPPMGGVPPMMVPPNEFPPPLPKPSTVPHVYIKVRTETETSTSYDVDTEYATYETTVTDTIYSTQTHLFYPEQTHTLTRTSWAIEYPGYTLAVEPNEPRPVMPPPPFFPAPTPCGPPPERVHGCHVKMLN